jgi:hypothetical protein
MSEFMDNLKVLIEEDNKSLNEKEELEKRLKDEEARINAEGEARLKEAKDRLIALEENIKQEYREHAVLEIERLKKEKEGEIISKKAFYESNEAELVARLIEGFLS